MRLPLFKFFFFTLIFNFYFLIFSSSASATDSTPPLTQAAINPSTPDGNNGWYKSPVDINLSATDDSSGVKSINWRLDPPGGSWQSQTFSNTLNLAPNPSFEAVINGAPTDWVFGGLPSSTGSSDSANYVFGQKSLKIISVENGWSGFNDQVSYIPAIPFANLTAAVWIKTQNVAGNGAFFKIYALTSNGPVLIASSSVLTGTNGFTRIAKSFTVTANDAYGIYLDLGLQGTGTVWFDGVSVSNTATDTQVTNTFASPGSHQLEYYSVDNLQNEELPHKTMSFKVDSTAPSNWRSFTTTGSGNDHTLISQIQVSDSSSGISVDASFFQYSVDAAANWGYYSNLKNCNSSWTSNGWLPITDITPSTEGANDVTLKTPAVDYCNSNWNVCKIMRFQQKDVAGNQSTKDICVNGAWVNIITGDVGSNKNVSFQAKGSSYNADGIIVSSGTVNNFDSSSGWLVQNYSPITVPSYGSFLSQYPTSNSLPQGQLPTNSGRYLVNSSYTISSATVPSGFTSKQFSVVVFVNGNLTINTDLNTVSRSSILFIVSGDILIDSNVQNLKALFIADGKLDTAYNGNKGKSLSINGLAVADSFSLNRNLSNHGNFQPSEQFFYQPMDLLNLSTVLGSSSVRWRETAP